MFDTPAKFKSGNVRLIPVTFIVVYFVHCSLRTSFAVVEIDLLRASEVTEFNMSPLRLHDLTAVLECPLFSIINCSLHVLQTDELHS